MRASMRDRILAAAVAVMKERGVTNTTTKEIARAAGVAEGSIYNHFANKTELVAASMAEVAGGIRDALTRLSGRVGESTVEDNLAELAQAEIAFFTDLLPITGPVLGDRDLREWLRGGGPHAATATSTAPSRRQDTGPAPAGPPEARPSTPGVPGPDLPGRPMVTGGANLSGEPEIPGGPRVTGRPNVPGGPEVPGSVPSGPQAPGSGQGRPALGPVLGHVALVAYLEAERQAGRIVAGARPPYLAAALIGACQQYAFVGLLTPPETVSALAGLSPDPGEYAREIVRALMAGHLPDSAYTA